MAKLGKTDSARGSSAPLRTPKVQRIETHSDSANRDPRRGPPSGYPDLLLRDPDRYELIAEHGRGGIGRVLRARDKELDRTIALKELQRPGFSSESRFVREAMITAKLQHPGIVPIIEAGRWPDGTPFYAMKLVEGESLKVKIADCKELNDRLALLPNVLAITETIAYAHSKGIIHRDLKPSNVIIGEFGETVVIDWGLAKSIRDSEDTSAATVPYRTQPPSDVTAAGAIVGTPAYMPPEQARGERVDERADVYALGAMLFHLLVGHAPKPSDLQAGLARANPRQRRLRTNANELLPTDLVAVLHKALHPEVGERYATARDLARDLRNIEEGKRVAAYDYSRAEVLAHWVRNHKRLFWAATGVVAILATVGVAAVLSVVQARDDATRERSRALDQRDDLILAQARAWLDRDPTASVAWLKQYPATGTDWPALTHLLADATARGTALHVVRPHNKPAFQLAYSRDGRFLVSASHESKLGVLDLDTLQQSYVDVAPAFSDRGPERVNETEKVVVGV